MGTPIIQIMEWNGNSTKTDKTASTVRFKSADSPTVDSSNPLTIPGAGKTYSFEKFLRLRIGEGDRAEQISNIKFYTDGGNSFGGNVFLFGHQSADFTHDYRSASQLSTNNNPPQGGSGSKTLTTVFAYTAAGGYSLSSAAETFSGTSTDIGRFVVMCMRVDPGATSGTLSAETLSFSYDTSAAATTANYTQIVSLNAAIAKTFTTAVSLDSVVGKAVDDGTFTVIFGVEDDFPQDLLLVNDFTELDFTSATPAAITSVTGAVGGSVSVTNATVYFTSNVTGTNSFKYIANYFGTVATGSVALVSIPFADQALILNFSTLTQHSEITEARSGTARGTGLSTQPGQQIVAYASGEQRYTALLQSATGVLGLSVEDTGGNALTNPNLSGGTTTPTGWTAIVDGTRSATASILGNADGALAFTMLARSVAGGGAGGRPFLQQNYTWSQSVTYTFSYILEHYSGGTNNIASVTGVGSGLSTLTGTTTLSGGQVSTVPHYMSMTFVVGDMSGSSNLGTVRVGLGVASSVSAAMTISRPMLSRGKSGRPSYTPDSTIPADRPTVALGTNFPYNTAAGSFVIEARTAPYLPNATAPGNRQVLFQIDEDSLTSTKNKQTVYRDISGNLHYIIVNLGNTQSELVWTGVPNDTTFRLALDYSASGIYSQLNSSTNVLSDTTVSALPSGLTILRLGHDGSGDHWNGTISEFNAYRSTSGLSGNPGGGAGGGTSSGGTTTTPPSQLPLNYYGVGHGWGQIGNNNLNIAGKQLVYRFRALQTGTISSIKHYLIWSTTTPGYSEYNGDYTQGPGGKIRIRILTNNPNAGAGGTGANVPTTTALGGFEILTAHQNSSNFPIYSATSTMILSAGNIYHIEWQNVTSNPTNYYCAVDSMNNGQDPVPYNPQIPELYEVVMRRNTATQTWTREPRQHLFNLFYTDGGVQGIGYTDVPLRTPASTGRTSVGGVNQIRQTFYADETFTATQFNIYGRMVTGNTAALSCAIRRESNGFLMDTVSISSNQGTPNDSWMGSNLNSNQIFSMSVTYTVTMSCSGTGFMFAPAKDGAASGQGFDPRTTVRGKAQYSTDSGSNWTNYKGHNDTSGNCDWMFYFLKASS